MTKIKDSSLGLEQRAKYVDATYGGEESNTFGSQWGSIYLKNLFYYAL